MAALFFGPDGGPLSKPADVIKFLGKGAAHWNRERSAYQAAHSWFLANGLPVSIQHILRSIPEFEGANLQRAVFENKTKLDSYGRESQTDILAVLTTNAGAMVLGVEAKVDESFGPLVDEWNDYSPGKLRRLAGLLERLELRSPSIASLRYQLLHRTVATLFEAEARQANQAAMVVQSFDKARAGFNDFSAFADALGIPVVEAGTFSRPKRLGAVTLRLGWTENQMQYGDD